MTGREARERSQSGRAGEKEKRLGRKDRPTCYQPPTLYANRALREVSGRLALEWRLTIGRGGEKGLDGMKGRQSAGEPPIIWEVFIVVVIVALEESRHPGTDMGRTQNNAR